MSHWNLKKYLIVIITLLLFTYDTLSQVEGVNNPDTQIPKDKQSFRLDLGSGLCLGADYSSVLKKYSDEQAQGDGGWNPGYYVSGLGFFIFFESGLEFKLDNKISLNPEFQYGFDIIKTKSKNSNSVIPTLYNFNTLLSLRAKCRYYLFKYGEKLYANTILGFCAANSELDDLSMKAMGVEYGLSIGYIDDEDKAKIEIGYTWIPVKVKHENSVEPSGYKNFGGIYINVSRYFEIHI